MRILKTVLVLVASLVLLWLPGCGGGSNSSTTAKDPFAGNVPDTGGGTTGGTGGGTGGSVVSYGTIMFTNSAGTAPGSQTNTLEPWKKDDVDATIVRDVELLQLLPFKVTDGNGNPRAGVPITLSVYSISGQNPDDVTIDFLVDPGAEPSQRTITTDSAGMGIFNVAVHLKVPQPGSFTASMVVFKATTNDPVPVTAYVGGSYALTTKPPAASP